MNLKALLFSALVACCGLASAQTGYFTDTQVPGHIDVVPTFTTGNPPPQYLFNSAGQIIVPNVPGATFTITVSGEGTIMCGGRSGCGSVVSVPQAVTLTEPDGTVVPMTESAITVLQGTKFATASKQFTSDPILPGTYQISVGNTTTSCHFGCNTNSGYAEHYGITGNMTQQ